MPKDYDLSDDDPGKDMGLGDGVDMDGLNLDEDTEDDLLEDLDV